MDLNTIEVFVKVVQSGSFSAAARLLNMPKSTVSKRVATLEADLKTSLIQRTTRQLNVTEAGRKYFERCVKALQELEHGEAEISAATAHPQGRLKITAAVDIGHTLLPRMVHAYLQAWPEMEVELSISNRRVDLVAEGFDLALRVGPMLDSSLQGRSLMPLRVSLWAAPHYLAQLPGIRTPADLARVRMIQFADRQILDMSRAAETARVPVSGRLRVDDLETIKALVLLGEGIGWLPDFLAAADAATGALVPALPGWQASVESDVHFLYPGGKFALPKVRAFVDCATALITKENAPG